MTPVSELPQGLLTRWDRANYENFLEILLVELPQHRHAAEEIIEGVSQELKEMDETDEALVLERFNYLSSFLTTEELKLFIDFHPLSGYINGSPARSGAPWTPEEDEYLTQKGVSNESLAWTLYRTPNAIRTRKIKLGLAAPPRDLGDN